MDLKKAEVSEETENDATISSAIGSRTVPFTLRFGTVPFRSRTAAPSVPFWNGTERNGHVHTRPGNRSGTLRTVLSCQCERGIS